MKMETTDTDTFQVKKGRFLFQMALKKAESQSVVAISLTHYISKEKYYIQINQGTIEAIEGLSKSYQHPAQLYEQLQLIINDIQIDEEGVITFELMIGKSKRRQITLKTEKVIAKVKVQQLHQIKQEMQLLKKFFHQETRKLNLEHQKLAKQLRKLEAIGQLKNDISQQKRQISGLNQEITTFKQILDEKNGQNVHLGEAISALNVNIKQLKRENQKLRGQVRAGNTQLQAVKQLLVQSIQRIQQVQTDLNEEGEDEFSEDQHNQQQQQERTQINCLKGHRAHQDNNFFSISKLNHNLFRLYRSSNSNRYNSFIHTYRVFQNSIVFIKMCVYSKQSRILLGVCTKRLLNRQDIQLQPDFVGLYFNNSSVLQGRKVLLYGQHQIGCSQIVEMEVDLINQKITWSLIGRRNQRLILQQLYPLPGNLLNKQLFLHITMNNDSDLVDLITD